MPSRFRGCLTRWIELGLALRIAAACAVQKLAERRGLRCLFPDTDIYWSLGQSIRRGRPYEVSQWDVPHFSLRAPGYPLFLAFTQSLGDGRSMPARLVQAVLGAVSVGLVALLVRRLTVPSEPASTGWRATFAVPALIAAAITAIDPYNVGFSVVLLSEALFLPFMLAGLLGLSCLWTTQNPARPALIALATGASWGYAILTKPSWALFPPLALVLWCACAPSRATLRKALLVVVGLGLMMGPWWVRNARVYGRFVPTALWTGASLYDGLNPHATGASDMRFMEQEPYLSLDEEAQDHALTRAARDFARSHPRRVLELAAAKAARYWSPWPNEASARSPLVRLACALWMLPLYALILLGAHDRRRDFRALVLLAGPVLYFAAIHMVFVSSVRYRVPGLVPAFGLAGVGLSRLLAPRYSVETPR